jgi:hypothetical protein
MGRGRAPPSNSEYSNVRNGRNHRIGRGDGYNNRNISQNEYGNNEFEDFSRFRECRQSDREFQGFENKV